VAVVCVLYGVPSNFTFIAVPEENFWTLWCKGRLTEADTPTIRLCATSWRLEDQQIDILLSYSALTLLFGRHEEHLATSVGLACLLSLDR